MAPPLLPIFVESTFFGRQNLLASIARALNPDPEKHIILPDILALHPATAQFRMYAHAMTRSPTEFYRSIFTARRDFSNILPYIPEDHTPVFLSYGQNHSIILAGHLLKSHRPDTKLISINNPHCCAPLFDLIAVPPSEDIVPTETLTIDLDLIPNPAEPVFLKEQKEYWAPKFSGIPSNTAVVIVGGSVPTTTGQGHGQSTLAEFTEMHAEEFVYQTRALAQKKGCLFLISNSPRTPRRTTEIVMSGLRDLSIDAYDFSKGGENPYWGYITHASAGAIVTGDSMSMLSVLYVQGF